MFVSFLYLFLVKLIKHDNLSQLYCKNTSYLDVDMHNMIEVEKMILSNDYRVGYDGRYDMNAINNSDMNDFIYEMKLNMQKKKLLDELLYDGNGSQKKLKLLENTHLIDSRNTIKCVNVLEGILQNSDFEWSDF